MVLSIGTMSAREKLDLAARLLAEVGAIADEVCATPATGTGIKAEAALLRDAHKLREAVVQERAYWDRADRTPAGRLQLIDGAGQ